MTRMLVLTHSPAMSGGEIALINTLREGIADEVTVATDAPGPLTEAVEQLPGGSASYRSNKLAAHKGVSHGLALIELARRFLAMRNQYGELFRSNDWDIAYANTMRSALVASTVTRRKTPLVFHLRDRLTADHVPRLLLPVIRRLLSARVDKWIANSHGTAATVPVTGSRVRVAYSPVSDSFFQVPARVPSQTVHIALIGRLARWKGQMEFLSALKVLNQLKPDGWTASIAGAALFGEHEYAKELDATIRNFGLVDKVKLTGHIDDVSVFLHDVDIVVHCSIKPEPFGQVVAQGMAAGRAVIASKLGGPSEIIKNRKDGILTDPCNAHELATELAQLLDDEHLRLELGRNAREAAQRFRASEVTKELKSFLFSGGAGDSSCPN